MAGQFVPIPDWFSWENQDCGVAVADLDGDGEPDVVVLMVDDPAGQNTGNYRIGTRLAADGTVSSWGPWLSVPDWWGWENQGAGIALADLSGSGRLDMVVFTVDHPAQGNHGKYRIARDLAADGTVTGGWTPWLDIPDWYGWENQGADICLTEIDGEHVLVVLTVDNPAGQNSGQFRLGKGLTADGAVTEWTPWLAVPDWWGWENQGAGVTVADLDGDGRPELIVFTVDHPADGNAGLYTVGWGLDGTGHCVDGWSRWSHVPDWGFAQNQGAAVAVLPTGAALPSLVVLTIDNPAGGNEGYLRVLDPDLDVAQGATLGAWRILDFGTEINPVHAALLHTGDVLFYAGSGNDPDREPTHDFATRVWHYPRPGLAAPPLGVDIFCSASAFLPDGRVLAAGGTEQYDPFFGLRDALLFDPATLAWNAVPDMTFGRWYPSLAALPSGKVVATSGLGTDGFLAETPELFDPATATWSQLPVPGPIPMFAHLVLLTGGRLFYTGGQYGGNNGMHPSIWDTATGAVTVVDGLADPDSRNQSTSVLLPPAQGQRVMLIGGGGYDPHQPSPATADTHVADLSAATPVYRPGPPLEFARMHVSAVVLPDRTVLACGGATMEEMGTMAPPHAELLDPATETWKPTAPQRVPRLYHSVALLTPDGKVITAGSNPARKTEETRIEVFWPPYLFRGPRPDLRLDTETAGYGGTLTATTTATVRDVNLLHPTACTHSCDNSQRLIDLPFTGSGTLTVTLPADPGLAPPGWYQVVVVDTDGIPSPGRWIHLG
ncbi:galactose oxidase-like domain-containing protein [Nocardia sp. BMG111209]|uniref:galactose oxidase-like domain-containing protein n=1 Tax=Nocardia sp. BMG111209 TaxID=1160137 RepID=UPI00037F5E51|nr:galactose oxidase-like domain-containing protein [Nocardia sp. BMG111209]